jgi:hypothetical protein
MALCPAYFPLPPLSLAYRALSHSLLLIALNYFAFSPLPRFIAPSLALPRFLPLTAFYRTFYCLFRFLPCTSLPRAFSYLFRFTHPFPRFLCTLSRFLPLTALYHAFWCLLRVNTLSPAYCALRSFLLFTALDCAFSARCTLSRFLLFIALYPAIYLWLRMRRPRKARIATSAQEATNKASKVAQNALHRLEKIMPGFSLLRMKLHFLAWNDGCYRLRHKWIETHCARNIATTLCVKRKVI